MTYDSDRRSVQGSRPMELYVFTVAGDTYRYTSSEIPITYGGNVYTPAVLVRNDIAIPTLSDTPELVIDIPRPDTMIQTYAFGAPPQTFTCKVYHYQITSAVAMIIWQGRVGGIAVEKNRARIRIPSLLGDALDTTIPSRHFGVLCSHVLYDEGCSPPTGVAGEFVLDDLTAVTAFNFHFDTSVSGTPVGKTIVVTSINGHVNGYYKNGRITRAVDGEHRQIVSQIGTTLTIDYPFRVLAATDAITLYAGCDKTVTTCRSKFDNVKNFGGHPDIPTINPFGGISGATAGWELT